MKQFILLLVLTIFIESCSNKSVQLPEIENSSITKIKDVSAAYLFYDETKRDSLEFNRKNLIGTTNWLVNVDKRLTLKQVLPHLVYLQNKRNKNGMHKNEATKNYFTCSNPSIENLSFIEFTDVVYTYAYDGSIQEEKLTRYNILNEPLKVEKAMSSLSLSLDISMEIAIKIDTNDTAYIFNEIIKKDQLLKRIKSIVSQPLVNGYLISFYYNQNLTFQDYINYKSLFSELDLKNVTIDNEEFIYN